MIILPAAAAAAAATACRKETTIDVILIADVGMTNSMRFESSWMIFAWALVPILCGLFLSAGFLGGQSSFPPNALPTSSGYLQLNRSTSSSPVKMFYLFYEAVSPTAPLPDTPILLWLQGGPGCSSMTGNFYELGPWRVGEDVQLHKNPSSWNQRYGLLFLDNPVGTGYSVAEHDGDIPVNQDQVAHDLHDALQQFYKTHEPFFRDRPFFIAGESYAGKYVPALGHFLMQRKHSGEPLRLDGLVIGNGLTDPVTQVRTHANTAHSFGLIDDEQKAHAEELAEGVVKDINNEDWQAAYVSRTGLMDWLANVTGLATVLDVRRESAYHCMSNGTEFLSLFLNRRDVKATLGADEGAEWVSCSPRVRRFMSNDTMKSVKWMVDELLDELPLLLFQGQYDIKDGVVSSEVWMKTLNWEGKDRFFASERSIWSVGGNVAGYWRSHGTLTHVVVRGAGHMVPADQSLHSQKMIERWVEEQVYKSR